VTRTEAWPSCSATTFGRPADLLDGADATALLDDEGAPDPEKVKAAVAELLARKPHYAKRISGDVGQGRPARMSDRPQRGAVGHHPVQDALTAFVAAPGEWIRYPDDGATCDQ
jgi:hypothetical protein